VEVSLRPGIYYSGGCQNVDLCRPIVSVNLRFSLCHNPFSARLVDELPCFTFNKFADISDGADSIATVEVLNERTNFGGMPTQAHSGVQMDDQRRSYAFHADGKCV